MLRVLLPRLMADRPPEPLPVHFHSRRIFILPTRYGLLFAGLLLVMLLGTLNFNNNLGLMLTFLLVSAAVLSAVYAYRNLRGILITNVRLGDCFAGESANLEVTASNPGLANRFDVTLRVGDCEATRQLPARQRTRWELAIPTDKRGRLCLPRLSISTGYPLGLFHAWVWIESQPCAVVYPRPEVDPPPLPRSPHEHAGSATARLRNGDEEFDHLRAFRSGDSPGRIAWKQSATRDAWISKQFIDTENTTVHLRWQDLRGMAVEKRLSRLTAWVLQAQRENLCVGLEMPGITRPPDNNLKHWHQCLQILGLYPDHAV